MTITMKEDPERPGLWRIESDAPFSLLVRIRLKWELWDLAPERVYYNGMAGNWTFLVWAPLHWAGEVRSRIEKLVNAG